MTRPPQVLLVDDGELEDVAQLLARLDVPFVRTSPHSAVPESAVGTSLVVATAGRLDAFRTLMSGSRGVDVIWIAVIEEDGETSSAEIAGAEPSRDRARLKGAGFDFLVRRPVHPEALRLLLLRCVYRGEERRRGERTPVGCEIPLETDQGPRRATLADLSENGCRLLTRDALVPGSKVVVVVPERMGAVEPIRVPGCVIRASFEEHLVGHGLHVAAIRFDVLGAEVRHELSWVLEDRARGPLQLSPWVGEESDDEVRFGQLEFEQGVPGSPDLDDVTKRVDTGEELERDRRHSRRARFERKLPQILGARAFVARDLSMNGIRIERCADLALGDRVTIAISGSGREEPMLMDAVVTRDDRENGWLLVFESVDVEKQRARLERLLKGLPSVDPLLGDESEILLTEIVEHRR